MSSYALIAVIAAACLGLGLAARYWWTVAVACIPSVVWLAITIPRWSEDLGDGVTGADWFLVGFIYIGAPVVVLVAVGVLVGRLLFGPPEPEPSSIPTTQG
jgi:hypothetical protein